MIDKEQGKLYENAQNIFDPITNIQQYFITFKDPDHDLQTNFSQNREVFQLPQP